MPQQHPGRLQVLIVDAHCKRKLFSTKTPTDPDELARRFCTPDNCLVVVLRDNRFLFRLERAPGSPLLLAQGQQLPPSASAGLTIMNATEAKCLFFSCAGVLVLLAYCIQLVEDARWKQYRQEHQCTVTDSRDAEPGLIFTRPAQEAWTCNDSSVHWKKLDPNRDELLYGEESMAKIIWAVYYVALLTIFCVGIFTAINYLVSKETTDYESDISTLYLDSFKSKNNCKPFEINPNLLGKNGKPVEIMVCDDQELHFFVPNN